MHIKVVLRGRDRELQIKVDLQFRFLLFVRRFTFNPPVTKKKSHFGSTSTIRTPPASLRTHWDIYRVRIQTDVFTGYPLTRHTLHVILDLITLQSAQTWYGFFCESRYKRFWYPGSDLVNSYKDTPSSVYQGVVKYL